MYFCGTLKEIDGHDKVEHSVSFLSKIGMSGWEIVNSYHKLRVDKVGNGLNVVAGYYDVIEALESRNGRCISVQWHPEEM